MYRLGLISKYVPVIEDNGQWVRNPTVITNAYVADGDLVYGEYKNGDAVMEARAFLKTAWTDFEMLDQEVDKILRTFTNLFTGCLIKSVEGIRLKEKYFWDQAKVINRHWLAANMAGEAFLGFNAFNTKKITGQDTIDFIEHRKRLAGGDALDVGLMAAVACKPKA